MGNRFHERGAAISARMGAGNRSLINISKVFLALAGDPAARCGKMAWVFGRRLAALAAEEHTELLQKMQLVGFMELASADRGCPHDWDNLLASSRQAVRLEARRGAGGTQGVPVRGEPAQRASVLAGAKLERVGTALHCAL